ncbi:hypothetical protein [Actinomadura sp. KC345]|nr:hypothetical protein [Actinomadura sp. KC345]
MNLALRPLPALAALAVTALAVPAAAVPAAAAVPPGYSCEHLDRLNGSQ